MINRNLMFHGDLNMFFAPPEPARRSTEILIDASLNKVKYGEKLRGLLTELGMSQKDLAKAIGVNERTVARYLNGDFTYPIKASVNEKINHALNDAKYYKGYEHMDAVEYRKLFKQLWLEFSDETDQTDLANKAGHLNQGNISDLLNNKYLIYSTEMQYDFLLAFYNLCRRNTHISYDDRSSKLAVFSDHHETAEKLEKLLFGDAAVTSTPDETDAGADVVDNVIDYLMSLPDDAQELILSVPLAFFDSFTTHELNWSDKKYKSARELIERFGQLSKDEQRSFYEGILQLNEDKKAFRYWDDYKTWHLFEMNDQYRWMMNSSRQRGIADPPGASIYYNGDEKHRDHSVDSFRSKQDESADGEKAKKEKQKKKHRFEEALNTFDYSCLTDCSAEAILDKIIDDIGFRLTMSPFEWHLWQLYISYIYTVQSVDRIEALFHKSVTEQGFSDITEHIMSLSSKEQEIIFINPMFFFDSAALTSTDPALNSTDRNREFTFIYISAYDFFSRYETLSDEEKQCLFQKAEDFRDSSDEWAGYPISCDYYDNYKEIPAYGNPRLQREAIESFLFDINVYLPDTAEEFKAYSGLIIRDISFKLGMTDEQWDVWCTVIEAVYNMAHGEPSKLSAEEIIDRLFEIAMGQR